MNFISNLISERVLYSLGWTLIHSLWQGFIVALFVGLVLILLKKRTARIRYFLAVGSLAAILLLAFVTFTRLYSDAPEQLSGNAEANIISESGVLIPGDLNTQHSTGQNSTSFGLSAFMQEFTGYFNHHFPFMVALWILGILLFFLKVIGGLVYSERMKFIRTTALPEGWDRTITALAERLDIKRSFRVLQSSFARVPMVIGYFKPVILLPLSVVSGIPGDQLEAIIAHELAHIRRHDFLVNLFQSLMEAVFFYHPAVWWISGIIRKEREHCCDDLAITVCNESLVYAKALVTLQEYSMNAPHYAVAMAGKRHLLLSRIKRITRKPVTRLNMFEKCLTAGIILLIVSCLSFTTGISGKNRVQAAFYPEGELSGMFLTGTTDPANPEMRTMVFQQDTVKKPKTSTINTRFFDDSDQKEKQVRMILENGEVKELYIDGERIPENEMDRYQELIEYTLAELKEAEEEMVEAESELERAYEELNKVDLEKMHEDIERANRDMEKAMQEFKNIDMYELQKEMETAREAIQQAYEKIEKEFDSEEFRENLRQIEENLRQSLHKFKEEDWERYRMEMDRAREEIRRALDEMERQNYEEQFRQFREEFREQWDDLDTTRIHREMERAAREMRRAMEEFRHQDWDRVREEMEEAKRQIRESLRELQEFQRMTREELRETMEYERKRDSIRSEEERRLREEARRRDIEEREAVRREWIEEELRHQREAPDRERRATDESEVMEVIRIQLLEDGFYRADDPIDFELSGKKLAIDGKKQSEELFEKYRQLYENHSGPLPAKGSVYIKK